MHRTRAPSRTVGLVVEPAPLVRPAIERGRVARAMLQQEVMEILIWLVIGLVAGVLASLIVGGSGYGIIGDIVIGIVGAFVGGAVFRAAGWSAPFGGMAGTIFVAFIGAVILLAIIHLIRGAGGRRRRL